MYVNEIDRAIDKSKNPSWFSENKVFVLIVTVTVVMLIMFMIVGKYLVEALTIAKGGLGGSGLDGKALVNAINNLANSGSSSSGGSPPPPPAF